MNNKLWFLIAGILVVAVLAMGWFIGVSPKLDEMNSANAQRESVERQNSIYEGKLEELEKQFAKIGSLKAELADAQLGLPPDDELATFLGQLHQLEASSGVTLTMFTAGDAQKYIAAPDATADPTVTSDNFVYITIDLTVKGSREQVIDFVSDLQNGNRLFLVTKLGIAQERAQNPGADDGDSETLIYSGSITGYVYVLVDPSAPPPTPTPVGSLDTEPTPSPKP